MSHFYASVQGRARTEATRRGSKSSGIDAHISSWDKGIRVTCHYDSEKDVNVFSVYLTGGSKHSNRYKPVYQYEEPCASDPQSYFENGRFSINQG